MYEFFIFLFTSCCAPSQFLISSILHLSLSHLFGFSLTTILSSISKTDYACLSIYCSVFLAVISSLSMLFTSPLQVHFVHSSPILLIVYSTHKTVVQPLFARFPICPFLSICTAKHLVQSLVLYLIMTPFLCIG